jgi:hypothetical protein
VYRIKKLKKLPRPKGFTAIEREGGSIDCTHLAQYRDQWRVLVNTEMNLLVP